MRNNIHPKYNQITVICSCKNTMKIFSTIDHDINIDVCNRCHPFYTGKQKILDKKGRVDRFNKRFNMYYRFGKKKLFYI